MKICVISLSCRRRKFTKATVYRLKSVKPTAKSASGVGIIQSESANRKNIRPCAKDVSAALAEIESLVKGKMEKR